jgi:NAD(P)-dependent dehydrogenase (short-subunit alcohol dehydrogenase family)
MNKTHSGRVALVTGAANGIGRATALAFANSGYSVVVSDIDNHAGQETVALIKVAGGDASFIRCDVSCDADVRLLIDGTVSAYGRLDCAFNNAGIEIERCKLADGNEGVFDAIMNVNVKGVWLCMKYQIAAMLAQGGGAIVNTASVAGLIAAPKQGIYSASKHAVIGLTKTAAVEYARKNIRVNAVCPAVIDTEMFRRASTDNSKHVALAVAAHPLGRIGTVEEIAAAVLYLCSDSAGFTTGVALPVDGGLTA